MIVISEETFDVIFKTTLKELEFELLKAKLDGKVIANGQPALDSWQTAALSELHRKFHYEVSVLKDKLAKA